MSQRIESLNAGLKGIASDLGVDFLNNDPIFHLQDGTLNDGYLLADGVHLTHPATNRLVANMQLSLRQGETCAYSDHRRKKPTQDSPAHTSVSDGGDNYSHPFWQKAKQKAQRGQPRGQATCCPPSLCLLVTYIISLVPPPDDLPHSGNHAMSSTGVTNISMTLTSVILYCYRHSLWR